MTRIVLIVEDNEKNLKLFRFLVESIGCKVLVATEGEEALRVAMETPPDLILLDIQLPVMDGVSVLRALRADEKTRHVPVIALTAYAMKGDRERLLGMGFDGYISKPIESKSFMETVERALKAEHG